jgi:hypothetical protein
MVEVPQITQGGEAQGEEGVMGKSFTSPSNAIFPVQSSDHPPPSWKKSPGLNKVSRGKLVAYPHALGCFFPFSDAAHTLLSGPGKHLCHWHIPLLGNE